MAAAAATASAWPSWLRLVPAEIARLTVPVPATVPGIVTVLAVPTPFRAATLPVVLAGTAGLAAGTEPFRPVDVCG